MITFPTVHLLRRAAALGTLLACAFLSAAQPSDPDLARQRADFISKLFSRCAGGLYYLGPREISNASCAGHVTFKNGFVNGNAPIVTRCSELIEYRDLEFPPDVPELPVTNTDRLRRIRRKALFLIEYSGYRRLMRTDYTLGTGAHSAWDASWSELIGNAVPTTSPELDNLQAHGHASRTARAFGLILQKNDGQWLLEPGPDFPLDPGLSQVVQTALGGAALGPLADALEQRPGSVGSGFQGVGVIEKIEREKPRSCTALPTPPLPASVPGHSLSDTYAQLRDIEQANASRGVRDDLHEFVGLPVCLSIDAAGRCVKAPESVYVPGDLAAPLDWEAWPGISACRQHPYVAVELKAAPHEKRFLTCIIAGQLTATRRRLIQAGVKPDEPATPAPSQPSPVSTSSGVHSLDEPYQRTVAIAAENNRRHIPDPIPLEYIPLAYACDALTPTGQCRRTGELVRVPGDLAQPLDWDALNAPTYCVGRLAIGIPVVLKNPSRPDGGHRVLRCSDAMRLARFYDNLRRLGIR